MKHRGFHNPDICMPIVRREICEELLDFFLAYLELAATRGKSATWGCSFPNRKAYYNAVYRLRKAGLVAYKRRGDNNGVIRLTEDVHKKMRRELDPRRFWKAKWSGTWFVLVYDVPEKRREYRDTLRRFLVRMRMGSLQRSVYISPFDVRPEYADLEEAAGLRDFAFLFESQALLGWGTRDIVSSAWDFERIDRVQEWYCEVYSDNLNRVRADSLSKESLQTLAREEMSAYVTSMTEDPFLPDELLPAHYMGKRVFDIHTRLVREIARRL